MRSVKAGSYQRLASVAALWNGWLDCRRGKRRRPTVAAFEIDCDRHIFRLQRELQDFSYRPSPWRMHSIRDPKVRLIAAPAVRDRLLHHALLTEIGPVFERRFIDQSFAAGHGRGPQRAALYYLAAQRRYGYRLHLDIQGYFLNIDHQLLQRLFAERIRDDDTLKLIRLIIDSGNRVYASALAQQVLAERCPSLGCGLPLGSWFSQWCGNFYLDALDHYLKRELKIRGYCRFMDDFVLFANDRQQLLSARAAIADWLAAERQLTLNKKRLAVVPTTDAGVFVGYRISRSGITPSSKLRRRFKQRIRTAANKGDEALIRTLRSYKGLLLFP